MADEGGGSGGRFDAVIIGAGFGGLYQLKLLREQGLKVRVFEAGSGVGGTWYWNRYPGARTDSPSHVYQYFFSDELLAEWNWSERFAAQPETERYLNWVADKFGLRSNISFNTRVQSAIWDEAAQHWRIGTDTGETAVARFLISCMGPLSAPMTPQFEGQDRFRGAVVHTSRWPKEGIELRNQRVGVVGTGATGIQVIQTIAEQVSELTVFQRTPSYTIPMGNRRYGTAEQAAMRARYPETRQRIWYSPLGFDSEPEARPWAEMTPAERKAALERLWADGSLDFWFAFQEVFFEPVVNAEVSEFVRSKIRARIHDPRLADKLLPKEDGFGSRRVPLENGYYEAFNRPNVRLVDVKAEPIECLTADGVKTAGGHYPLDVLILATGFDASTGPLTRVDIRGRKGRSLRESWAQDLRTALGLQVHGFPNLFMTSAPFSPGAAFCNAPICLQQGAEWIADCISHLLARQASVIEVTPEFEAEWMAHHDALTSNMILAKARSWYTGANVEGKQRRVLGYLGAGNYRRACDAVRANGYQGFVIA